MRKMYPKLKIRNIKASFFINKSIPLNTKMLIFNPVGSLKITIYRHSPKLINVTGISSRKTLKLVKDFLKRLFQCKITKQRIDAIMLNYKSKKHMKINLNKLSKICLSLNLSDMILDYNCERFNAPFLKSSSGKGTFLLFSSGSVQI